MLKIISKSNIWFGFSGLLILLSILSLIMWGLNLGIDFTGGSLLEVKFQERPAVEQVQENLSAFDLGDISIQPTESDKYIIRSKTVNEEVHQKILSGLQEKFGEVEEQRFESIGSAIGEELQRKAFYAIIAVLIAIILYVAWAFRKVSRPVQSWKYGVVAVVTVFHDVFITLGIFSVLGYFYNIEIGLPFVAAVLTILGYSVNDTIVVFDRIRENLFHENRDFGYIVNKSVNETITRSINTSLTTFLVLSAILIWGGATIQYFILTLMIGVLFGTYSSIFIASPLLVVWNKIRG